jgi:hypothetical protein
LRDAYHLDYQHDLVPDMPIEPGDKTDEPIRTRGWTNWHQVFPARHRVVLSSVRARQALPSQHLDLASMLNIIFSDVRNQCYGESRWSRQIQRRFRNQALNTFFKYGVRASLSLLKSGRIKPPVLHHFPTLRQAETRRWSVVTCSPTPGLAS